jgi:hypothetical protein
VTVYTWQLLLCSVRASGAMGARIHSEPIFSAAATSRSRAVAAVGVRHCVQHGAVVGRRCGIRCTSHV